MDNNASLSNEKPRDYAFLKRFYEYIGTVTGGSDAKASLIDIYKREGNAFPYEEAMTEDEMIQLMESGGAENRANLVRLGRLLADEKVDVDALECIKTCVGFYYGDNIVKLYSERERWLREGNLENKVSWLHKIFFCCLWRFGKNTHSMLGTTDWEEGGQLYTLLQQDGKLWGIKPGEQYDIVKTREGYKYKGCKKITAELLEDKEQWEAKMNKLCGEGYVFGRFVYLSDKSAYTAQKKRFW